MFDHVKRVQGWTTMACHIYESVYYKVMTIAIYMTCNLRTLKHNALSGGSWTQLLKKKGWIHPFSKGSWQIVPKQIRMLFALFIGLEILWWTWLTKSRCVFSIGLNFLTNIPSNWSLLSFMINTKPFIMITRKPCPWRKLTFNMLPFDCGGTLLELQVRAPFTSSTIGATFGTFVCYNGKASSWM